MFFNGYINENILKINLFLKKKILITVFFNSALTWLHQALRIKKKIVQYIDWRFVYEQTSKQNYQ